MYMPHLLLSISGHGTSTVTSDERPMKSFILEGPVLLLYYNNLDIFVSRRASRVVEGMYVVFLFTTTEEEVGTYAGLSM